jgi:hypothetical protein
MSRTRTLLATTAIAVGSSTALIMSGVAGADPAGPPQPGPAAGLPLPGLPAIEQLSPVIQQAAADPGGAASLLMAAAAAFTGSSAAPTDSKQVADSVTQFVQTPAAVSDAPAALRGDPAAHVPTPGSAPGAVAHLPTGVDPANAVGPRAAPAAPEAAPATPVPEAAPAPAPPAPQAAAAPPAPSAPSAPEASVPSAPEASGAAPEFSADSPPTQDFMYPSIGSGCQSDGGNSIATALSVAGPATIPSPGPGPGQTAYVFTAVGTPGPAEAQKLPLNVTWVNLTTGKSGSATLKPRPDINPDGPTTLTAIADTGSGSIMSTIFGQVTTKDHQCNFIPTIGSAVVP